MRLIQFNCRDHSDFMWQNVLFMASLQIVVYSANCEYEDEKLVDH